MSGPIRLRAGESTAEIHPAHGGRLGRLDLGGGPLLRAAAPGLSWDAWGCYPLLPWSNRIPAGHLVLGDIDARLPVNSADGSAIHGLVADRPWGVEWVTPTSAVLAIDAEAGPYAVRGELAYELVPGGLTMVLLVTNAGAGTVPAGLGIHPWFRAGEVQVPADLMWPGEPLPTGPAVPVDADGELRAGRVPPPMDRCYTGLTDTRVRVSGATLSWDGPVTQVVVYSGEPGWVAVEPVTMANDGFGLAERGVPGHGVRLLGPGDRLRVAYRFEAAGP